MGLLDALRHKPKVSNLSDELINEAYQKEMIAQAERIGKEKAKADADFIIKQNKEAPTRIATVKKSKGSSFISEFATNFKKNADDYRESGGI